MADIFELQAQPRIERGKRSTRRMRRQDEVPAVIYGAGKEPTSLKLQHNKVIRALENQAFYSHILTIDVEGNKEKAILRDIQRHPYKSRIMHIDFLRISPKEKITMSVPLHFLGEDVAPGVKNGGVISHLLSSVEISCLPGDLPEYIELDISNLDLDQPMHLSELKLPKGVALVQLTHDNDLPVVSIHLPRVAIEEIAAPEATEVIEGKETQEAKEEGEKEGKKE